MILIIGYFHRNNLGDDAFEHVWRIYMKSNFPNVNYQITNLDDISFIDPSVSLVLFGGGDLINDYFIPKLWNLMKDVTVPCYAIGVGIPYPKLIDENYLDKFDYIIHRSQIDHYKLSQKYSSNKYHWYPDLTYLMNLYEGQII